jgi:plasmid replication initiation protein
MKLFEDYKVVEFLDNSEAFIIEIVNPDLELFGWKFRVNSIKFDKKDEDNELMIMDYDLINPEFLPEEFSGNNDERITKILGDALIDMIEIAIKENSFKIVDGV